MERVGRDLHDALAGLHCPTREAQQDSLATRLQADEAATRRALTGYPYWVEAIHARGS
jgi:hypothetical protein